MSNQKYSGIDGQPMKEKFARTPPKKRPVMPMKEKEEVQPVVQNNVGDGLKEQAPGESLMGLIASN